MSGVMSRASRVAGRKGHFMPASLIDSQFAELEPPAADEVAIALDATRDPDELVAEVICDACRELPASRNWHRTVRARVRRRQKIS